MSNNHPGPVRQLEYVSPQQTSPAPSSDRQAVAAKGLAQAFGLDIRAAILTILVDMLLFGEEVVSLGTLIPLSIAVACVLGFIVYKMQTKWYGDDHDSGLIKALVVGLVTAIPAPITPVIAIPGGILGLINMLRKK